MISKCNALNIFALVLLITLTNAIKLNEKSKTRWSDNWRMVGDGKGGIMLYDNEYICTKNCGGDYRNCHMTKQWNVVKNIENSQNKYWCLTYTGKASTAGYKKVENIGGNKTYKAMLSKIGVWVDSDVCNSYCQTKNNRLCDYFYNTDVATRTWYKCN